MIEAQKYNYGEGNPRRGFVHVGYMNKVFKSKSTACNYYNHYQGHMVAMNSKISLSSDWDTRTGLRFVVRHYTGEYLGYPAFEDQVSPVPKMGPSSL